MVQYKMYVFKITNIFYTTEVIELPDIPIYQLINDIKNGKYGVKFSNVKMIFVPYENNGKYAHPFIVER